MKRSSSISNIRFHFNNIKKVMKKNLFGSFVYGSIASIIAIGGTELVKQAYMNYNGQESASLEEMEELKNNNDKLINELLEDSVVVTNMPTNLGSPYSIKDSNLYDTGKKITLDDQDRAVFLNCRLDEATLQNMNIHKSNTSSLFLDFSWIDEKDFKYLPEGLQILSFRGCYNIKNLENIPDYCPNIRYIILDNMPLLTDLNFLKRLPKLEKVSIRESSSVTPELVAYLDENNIRHNITEHDLKNTETIDNILKELDLENDSDEIKIKKIVEYIVGSLEYDLSTRDASNVTPLTQALEDGKVVCASYTYLTSVLLNKAGIEVYQVADNNHAWNLLNLNENYYYLDCTNINDSLDLFVLDLFDTTDFYMLNPDDEIITSHYPNATNLLPSDVIAKMATQDNFNEYTFKYSVITCCGYIVGFIAINGCVLLATTITEYKEDLRKAKRKELHPGER